MKPLNKRTPQPAVTRLARFTEERRAGDGTHLITLEHHERRVLLTLELRLTRSSKSRIPSETGRKGMRVRRLLRIALIAGLVLAASFTATSASRAQRAASDTPATAEALPVSGSALPIRIPFRIKSLARHWLEGAGHAGHLAPHLVAHELKTWRNSHGTRCHYLPRSYFCPRSKSIWYRWGLGYALSWRNKAPGAWNSPSWPRHIVYVMTPGRLFWLTCWTRGDTVTDGGIVTNLWYRMPSGNYVNDGWVDTGTNNPILGVRHC